MDVLAVGCCWSVGGMVSLRFSVSDCVIYSVGGKSKNKMGEKKLSLKTVSIDNMQRLKGSMF